MAGTTIVLTHTDPLVLDDPAPKGGREALRKVINLLEAFAAGNKRAERMELHPNGGTPVPATATVSCVNVSVDDTVTIGGVVFTAKDAESIGDKQFSQAGSDAADATSLAAVINGTHDDLINGLVRAVVPAKDKLTANGAEAGNSFVVTLADNVGHRFVGKAGAATLGVAHFSIDTSNNATATDIAAQVNAYAPFSGKLRALAAAAVVHFMPVNGETFTLVGTATKLAESGGNSVTIYAAERGALGNHITIASSNGTRLPVSGSQARLARGAGGAATKRTIILSAAV
jgi:hypothetical protein